LHSKNPKTGILNFEQAGTQLLWDCLQHVCHSDRHKHVGSKKSGRN